jgi:hypothetical protein
MRHDLDLRLVHVVEQQHGVFDVAVLDRLEFTPRMRRHRISVGRWVRLHDGVYRMAGTPLTWRGRLLAACLAGGPTAAGSHRSAAAIWDTGGGDRSIQEILCRRWRRSKEPGLVIHETKVLDACDVTSVDGIPVTTVERTLLDLGAVRHPLTVERAVEAALRKELTTLPDLRATVRRLGRPGRNGAGVLRRIIDERDPDRRLTESAMEMKLLQVLRAHGLPEPVTQYEIRDRGRFVARVDAAYPDLRIALEYESLDWHTGKAALLRDSARRNALVALDWRPIAVTVEDLRSGGQAVCDQILRIRLRAA